MKSPASFGPIIEIQLVDKKYEFAYKGTCKEYPKLSSEVDSAQEAYDNLMYLIDKRNGDARDDY